MKKTQIDTHIHMGCRTIEEGLRYNWQLEDMKNFKVPHGKVFFVFGGNTTNCPEAANGNAKVIERLLTIENRKKSSIYSFVYDAEPISTITKALSEEYEDEIHQIFEKIFKPLLLDNVGNLKEKQGIEKVFKNLVFVSHCGGSNFANTIIDDIYDMLTTKYHSSIADHLISKIQYFSYAPNELPDRKVKSFVIAPFYDVHYSWSKVLSEVQDKRIDVDYPKSIMKKIFKVHQQHDVSTIIEEELKDQRLILVRAEGNIYLIPSRINPNKFVGDHSIDCLVKKNVLESDSEFAETAKLLNYSSELILNQFANEHSMNFRQECDRIVQKINNCKQNEEVMTDRNTGFSIE